MTDLKIVQLNNVIKELLDIEVLGLYGLYLFFWINLILPYLIFVYGTHCQTIIFVTRSAIGALNLLALGFSINKQFFDKYGYVILVSLITINVPALSFVMYLLSDSSVQWLIHLFISLSVLLIIVDYILFFVLIGVGVAVAICYCWILQKNFLFIEVFFTKEFFYMLFYLSVVTFFFARRKTIKIRERVSLAKTFGYAVAHELCTPLAAIRLYTNSIDKMTIKSFKSKINGLVNKGLKFIEVLAHGLDKSESKMCSIREIYNDFIVNCFLDNSQKKAISCSIIDNFNITVDRTFFFFVLNNLIKNSFEHSERSSDLLINITAKESNGQKLLIYEDNGIGMYGKRVNGSAKIKGYNMGVGMPLSKFIMNHFGGNICYDSNTRDGLKFILTFE